MMILLKITVTILAVAALSIVAERASPRAAGILSGYPAGSAIALFFIGLEQGASFAGASAPFNVAGLAASLSFMAVYYWVSRHTFTFGRLASILAAFTAAACALFAVDALLHLLNPPAWASVLVAITAILGFGALFRHIPNAGIIQRVRLNPPVLLFRAVLSAAIILAITWAANLVPPSWAGLFSAFPATAFPLVLIIHITYGAEQAYTIIKNFPTGLWSLVLYSLTVWAAYPRMGIYWGTLAGFGAATIFLIGLALINARSFEKAIVKKRI